MKDGWFEKLAGNIRRNGEWIERMRQVQEMEIFTPMVDILPKGVSGSVRVEHFEVSEEQSELLGVVSQLSQEDRWWEYVPPGRYARLTIGGKLFMTDSLFEKFSALPFIDNARGEVLVTGLGLGMVVPPLMAKRDVKRVTIIEKDADVIRLIEPHMRFGTRLKVVHADAYTWDGGTAKYDTIFHDIWPTVNPANLMLFPRIEVRYAKWLAPQGWQDCWSKEICELKARTLLSEVTQSLGGDPMKWPDEVQKSMRGWAL